MKTPNSLEHLTDWLRTRNPHEKYSYEDNQTCLLAQYGRSIHGDAFKRAAHHGYFTERGYCSVAAGCFISSGVETDGSETPNPEEFDESAWTFGRALERAERVARAPEKYEPKDEEGERRNHYYHAIFYSTLSGPWPWPTTVRPTHD